MSYVLRERVKNRYYCKDHDTVIEFDTIEEARDFLANFSNYAIMHGMGMSMMGGFADMGSVQQVVQSTTIDEKPECETMKFINWKDVKK
jgi:hypothetical protein